MDVAFGALAILGYIDPGTGSLLIQVLAATLISAGLFFKGLRERVVWLFISLFRRGRSSSPSSGADEREHSADEPQKRKAA